MIAFIEFYKNEFEFDVQETIDLLKAMIANLDHYFKLTGDCPVNLGNGKGFTYEADESGNITATEWTGKHFNDQNKD